MVKQKPKGLNSLTCYTLYGKNSNSKSKRIYEGLSNAY